jgi:hypothetical protein
MAFRVKGLCAGLLALSVALVGCSSSEYIAARDRAREANTMAPAPGYRDDIVAFMRTYLNNPVGVRNAFIAEPGLHSIEGIQRNSVCLRYTARKSDGQYAPSKDSLVVFRDGRLDRIVDTPRDVREACKDAAYQPFPELERLR